MLKVVLLGHLAERAGWREREMEVVETLSALIQVLALVDPRLGDGLAAPGVRAAVNHTISTEDTALKAGDEIAFLPIYSGG
jgi:molybdopterin synthase sulfur carrier subunit